MESAVKILPPGLHLFASNGASSHQAVFCSDPLIPLEIRALEKLIGCSGVHVCGLLDHLSKHPSDSLLPP